MQTDPTDERAELRKFALVVSAAFVLIFGVAVPWLGEYGFVVWPYILGGLLAGTGLVAPLSLRHIHRAWMGLARGLHHITTPVILTLVFVLVFLPSALIMRIIRRDSMKRSFDEACQSYRIKSMPLPKNHFERPF